MVSSKILKRLCLHSSRMDRRWAGEWKGEGRSLGKGNPPLGPSKHWAKRESWKTRRGILGSTAGRLPTLASFSRAMTSAERNDLHRKQSDGRNRINLRSGSLRLRQKALSFFDLCVEDVLAVEGLAIRVCNATEKFSPQWDVLVSHPFALLLRMQLVRIPD